jgi:hypothetical protein
MPSCTCLGLRWNIYGLAIAQAQAGCAHGRELAAKALLSVLRSIGVACMFGSVCVQ